MPGPKAKQFLKRVLPRSIAILFATSALMMPVVIPAQVLVSDIDAEGNLSSIDGEMATADTTLGDMLAELQGSFSAVAATPMTSLPTLPAPIANTLSYATQACGLTGTLYASIGPIAGDSIPPVTITSPLGDPLDATAPQICAEIIMYRAQSYNDTLSEMTRLIEYRALLATLEAKATAALTVGEEASVTAQATTIMADLQVEMAVWQTRKEAFDIAIKFLEEEQNTLTQTNLNGSGLASMVVSGGIQAAVLQTALEGVIASGP